MLIRKPADIPSSEITDERLYLDRRRFLGRAGAIGLATAASALAGSTLLQACARPDGGGDAEDTTTAGGAVVDTPTPYKDVTGYNNFYEFGTDKEDPSNPDNTRDFRPAPWTVAVEGMVKNPARYALEDFVKPSKLEERVYRMRCVEGWSMVIPWLGFPLADVLRRAEPLPGAKFVEFTTLYDPKQMPGQRHAVLEWPYTEGLRLDEAMHPLTILSTGIYGKPLLPQNGAPLRLVVPWKYGFKGIKSIVRIRLVDQQPRTAWSVAAPNEYGFYSNVNPTVDHPRWSQAKERRIGEFRRRPTLMFNGYADQVASLYSGMDLRKFF
ncbi:MAG TPA: protein-methionine-sulfoxide reductase catalytic subunit MsrP [Gemmatimonadaceae bacterium]|nr:protein-methionine-sulfoxide reductase catalytic subunit MsrP [Gemmatimonadaceae bacterium]